MSRLDINIRRLKAQRACLNRAAELIRELPGPVFELGLGNGRTYDHLREILPGREIYVFDREVAAHPDCVPEAARLFLGRFEETLPSAAERFRRQVALLHADFGTANAERDRRIARQIADRLPALLRPGAVVVSDRDVGFAGAAALDLPAGFAPGVYFMYRHETAAVPAGGE